LAELSESAIHPEGNAIHGLVEGTISEEMGGPVRGVSLLRAKRLAARENKITIKRCAELDVAARLRLNFCD